MVMILEAQGYDIENNIIFQYNQSTIRMANNGGDYCTGNSRNINIRHLFDKNDIVDHGEIEVKYCPNHLIIADYFTKALQRKLCKMFCDLIMGYVHINDLLQENELSAKESVEKSNNVTVNSITNNGKINYANVWKASKNKDAK